MLDHARADRPARTRAAGDVADRAAGDRAAARPPSYGVGWHVEGFVKITASLAAIMHDVARFYRCVERTSVSNPTGWIGVMPLAVQRVWG